MNADATGAASALREVLALIDAGSLEATTAQRAFIAGAVKGSEL